jgi:2-polyprenyl-3-methyl-5-hydroxy-6-metoxy-1,4-benzoquinol methylase
MTNLISDNYRQLNVDYHESNSGYGAGGKRRKKDVEALVKKYRPETLLDYGCGKGSLKKSLLQFRWYEYDPCIPGKDIMPAPADLVICADVLEHVEHAYVENVLEHLACLTKKAIFLVIGMSHANKFFPDGRNTHITLLPWTMWSKFINVYFRVITKRIRGNKLFIVAEPK